MSATPATGGREVKGLATLQKLGRSLMLPIAVLPAAGLLARLGDKDMLGSFTWFQDAAAVIAAAGGAILDGLPLLFAVGVAIGFARKADGSTALSAVVGYLVMQGVFKALSPVVLGKAAEGAKQPLVDYKVLGGILVGVVAALLWQKYHRIKLPPYLAFFGGRRFVPILLSVVIAVLAVPLALIYPYFNDGLTWLGQQITANAVIGGGAFGVLNRFLLPLGLHHIVNTTVWQVFGDFTDATGKVVHGDYNRFLAGDPSAGTFLTGFFPIMMFALPAAALAIWHTAKPAQRKLVGGIMLSAALTAFLTGVTEPLEFAFMFVAWPLYIIHAILTGVSLALVNALDIHHGFSFSAGAIDYVLNFGIAQKPLLLIPIGLAFAAVYYFLFRFVITKWNLATPGREDDATAIDPSAAADAEEDKKAARSTKG
ncbi:PTS transporter subunit EIIC [Crossiella sp. NPDC003009]